jgi:hypothetical protein
MVYKNIKYVFITLTLFFMVHSIIHAAPTASVSATPAITGDAKTKQQIEDLKDRLATKVAELRQLKAMAIFGTVKSTSVSSITVSTAVKDIKIDLNDNISVFQFLKGKRTALKTDDISKNDNVVIFGDYDSTLDLLTAKVVFIQSALPVKIEGKISKVDTKEFAMTVTTDSQQTYIIDYEKYTTANIYNNTNGIAKISFSKIPTGLPVIINGVASTKKDNRMSADRILVIDANSQASPSATPALTPTVKVTPTPTTKTIKITPTVKPTTKITSTPAI